jgi:hypothetical protein
MPDRFKNICPRCYTLIEADIDEDGWVDCPHCENSFSVRRLSRRLIIPACKLNFIGRLEKAIDSNLGQNFYGAGIAITTIGLMIFVAGEDQHLLKFVGASTGLYIVTDILFVLTFEILSEFIGWLSRKSGNPDLRDVTFKDLMRAIKSWRNRHA